MKKLLLLLALATPAFAQTPATPSGLGSGTTGTTATTPGAAKAKPLDAGDKKFVKDALDGMYYVMDLVGKAKNNAKGETTKKLSASLKTDLDKIWEDVGGLATQHDEKVPNELSGGDKGKAERLAKAGDKFDKEFTKIVSKEVDRLAKTFETAGKSGQDPTVKELGVKWAPTLKDHAIKADAAEKEAAKAK
jgi:predicted outer membrane protein